MINLRKNNEPRTEPCGTLAVTDFQNKDWPLRTPIDICCLKTI